MASSSHRDEAPGRAGPPAPAAASHGSVDRWTPRVLAGGSARPRAVAPDEVTAWRALSLGGAGTGAAAGAFAGVDALDEAAEDRTRSYEEGREAGRAEAMSALAPAARALQDAAQALGGAREEILRDLHGNVTTLALAVAKRILEREVSADPGIVRDLVAQGLELVKPDSPIEIRVHPQDLETVREGLGAGPGDDAVITWTADPAIERGGFFIEGPRRIVDGRLDEAMRVLYERLAYE